MLFVDNVSAAVGVLGVWWCSGVLGVWVCACSWCSGVLGVRAAAGCLVLVLLWQLWLVLVRITMTTNMRLNATSNHKMHNKTLQTQ